MMKPLVFVIGLGIAGAAAANPVVTETINTYPVSAQTLSGLHQEMRRAGPQGYWGYTRWSVNWSGTCQVRAHVDITLPEHANPAALPAHVRRKFDAMLAALTAHERQHGRHGILAAQEIARSKCRDPHAIIRKYNAIDLEFDRSTRHGGTEGVTLN